MNQRILPACVLTSFAWVDAVEAKRGAGFVSWVCASAARWLGAAQRENCRWLAQRSGRLWRALAQRHVGWAWVRAAARSVWRFRVVCAGIPTQHPGHVVLHTQEQLLVGWCERLGHRSQGLRHMSTDTAELIDTATAQARHQIALVVLDVLTRHPAFAVQSHQPTRYRGRGGLRVCAQAFLWLWSTLEDCENFVFPARHIEAPFHLALDGRAEVGQLGQYAQRIAGFTIR